MTMMIIAILIRIILQSDIGFLDRAIGWLLGWYL